MSSVHHNNALLLVTFFALAALLSGNTAYLASASKGKAHDSLKDQRLDETFAGYLQKMCFGIIVEHTVQTFTDGPPKSGTAEYDAHVVKVDNLLAEIGAVYARELEAAGLDPPGNVTGFPEDYECTSGTYFDLYSYAQFKTAAKYIPNVKDRHKLTKKIGNKVYMMMKAYLQIVPTSDPEDLDDMQHWLDMIVNQFVEIGYLKDGGVDWPKKAHKKWAADAELSFEYWMVDPVILPSAQRLYDQYGFAQHFSSRTIQQLFEHYLVDASEDDTFDPREHDSNKVVEKWTIKGL